MSVREYVGARYVPVFATPIDWNSANTYEPLTIVLHEGNSYTSRQAVPAGIQITNTAYWAQTGNYNAQIEQYRQDVAALASKFPVSVLDGGTGGTDAATARTNLDAAQADGATNTLYDAEQAIAANAADIVSLQDSVVKTKSFSVTTGTDVYNNMYYGDIATGVSSENWRGIMLFNSTNNRPVLMQKILNENTIRVWSYAASTSAQVILSYV